MNAFHSVFALIFLLVILGSISAWGFAIQKYIARQPLLAIEPRKQARWSLLEIFITVMMMFTLQGLAGALYAMADSPRADVAPISTSDFQEAETPNAPPSNLVSQGWMIALGGVASLIACGLGGLLIVMRTGCGWGQDLGLTLRQASRDVSYGVVAYVMLAPIIGAIQALLQYWYPSEHPLIKSFRANPSLEFFIVCVFAAGIVAPMVEEFICRVLIQGWLERVFAAKSIKHALFPETLRDEQPFLPPEAGDVIPITPDAGLPAEEGSVAATDEGTLDLNPSRSPSSMPFIISALLFAVMHWGHGADPIPLFVLALGLGYLYQRTHRILPCVVLHFLVNAVALAMLALSLVAE